MAADLDLKFEDMKIDVHAKKPFDQYEVPLGNKDPSKVTSATDESLHSTASVSSEGTADVGSSYGSKEEYLEPALFVTPNALMSPHLYAGVSAPIMTSQGYLPYPIEGVNYQSPVVDYSLINQQLYAGMPYTAQMTNGYVYGPHIYQYAPQIYYPHQASLGQYAQATPGMPPGAVMMPDAQDPGVLTSQAFSNIPTYASPVAGFPMTMVPQLLPVESAAFAIPAVYPPRTLRASAPAWVEPSSKQKAKQQRDGILSSGAGSNNKTTSVTGAAPKNTSDVKGPVSGDPNSTAPEASDSNALNTISQGNDARMEHLNSQAVTAHSVQGQNKGLWAARVRSQQFATAAKVLKNGTNLDSSTSVPDWEQYNLPDFVVKYESAKHFIIKSYSEENVQKSIQYGVWASTPNGNKKLDEAYQDAQRQAIGKPHGCPVFLFFSVNGSGQFCGVAEMTGPVDYNRTMGFWEQHKWSGSFPVKWHIVKDVPNSQLRRIILQNNENKPVTNSRDTQEVNLQQGLEMLSIFKSYPARASIMDGFLVHSMPQHAVQDMKSPLHWSPQSFPKIGEGLGKTQAEELNTKPTSAALRDGDNAVSNPVEVDSQGKAVPGKVIGNTEIGTDKDKEKKSEKENIKATSKEQTTAAF